MGRWAIETSSSPGKNFGLGTQPSWKPDTREPRARRSAWPDRLPLLVGVLSSLTLAIAAWSDVADPVVAGRHALVVAVSDLAQAVSGEWLRFADGARPQTFGVPPEQVAIFCEYPTTRTIDTFVRRLRKKIEADPDQPQHLITVHGVGYKLER